MKKYIKVSSVKEYFALPKKEREWHGWYLKPYALPSELFSPKEEGWETFSKLIRKEYPIQGWFREWFLSTDNFVYREIVFFKMRARDRWYNLRRFIFTDVPRFRKSWPRWQYKDICSAIVDCNFALICDFYHEEVVDGVVDWQADPEHQAFFNWLSESVFFIEFLLPRLEEKARLALHGAVNDKREGVPYEVKYKEMEELEKRIKSETDAILKKMIDFREYFWT
jgi:hypothetical protein